MDIGSQNRDNSKLLYCQMVIHYLKAQRGISIKLNPVSIGQSGAIILFIKSMTGFLNISGLNQNRDQVDIQPVELKVVEIKTHYIS